MVRVLRVVIVVLHVVAIVFSGGDTPMHTVYILLTVCTHVEQINSVSFFTYCVQVPVVHTTFVFIMFLALYMYVVQASRHPDLILEDLSGVVPFFSLY